MTLILTANDLRGLIAMERVIDLVEGAFVQLANGSAVMPEGLTMLLPGERQLFLKPAYLPVERALGAKQIAIVPENASRGMPTAVASLLLIDPDTGELLALMDAAEITALRTAAGSAVATRLLAKKEAGRLCVIGSGTQAAAHVEAIQKVRPIAEVRVYSPDPERRSRFSTLIRERFGLTTVAADTAANAAAGADIIVTATTSHTPVLSDAAVEAGAHLNCIGSYLPQLAELESETVRRARIFGDHAPLVAEHSGLLQGPDLAGRVEGSIGDVALGRVPGRRSAEDITLFISVGLGVQDVAVAASAYGLAREKNLGLDVDLHGFVGAGAERGTQ